MASYTPAYDYSKPSLRDALLDALRNVPGTRSFHLHVLISAPTLHDGLFKFAKNPPRTYAQDILVLCSEQTQSPVSASRSEIDETQGEQSSRANPSTVVTTPRVLVAAIEATLYYIRSTNSCILYVRKVDSTGYSQGPSPTTTLVRAFLKYYADLRTRPARHLWIQLFASARGQYLFPDSEQNLSKHLLGDVQLCVWWKRILSDVSTDLLNQDKNNTNPSTGPRLLRGVFVRAYYFLPGLSPVEAERALRIPSYASNMPWTYGHPYTQDHICQPNGGYAFFTERRYLGDLIPYFGDDPKSRLLDEIASATGTEVEPPVHKGTESTSSVCSTEEKDDGREKEKEQERAQEPFQELGKVTLDEFWEHMSFRQDCVADTVTGFFTVIVTNRGLGKSRGRSNSQHSRRKLPYRLQTLPDILPGQIPLHIYKRILTTLTTEVDYSMVGQAVKATEIIENMIKQLCESTPASSAPGTSEALQLSSGPVNIGNILPERDGHTEVDFTSTSVPASAEIPARHNELYTSNSGRGQTDTSTMGAATPITSSERYHSYIYGTVDVRNPVSV